MQGKNYFTYDRALFGAAAAWNLIGAAVLLIQPESQLGRLGIADPRAIWLARSLASSAMAWGIGYLLIALNPPRFRQFIWLGAISKTLFALISLWGFLAGGMDIGTPAIVDSILAVLFAERLVASRSMNRE
ncbi:MAG: hypothetical protein ABI882_13645 [Acidobacteriota bacterium]